MTMTCEMCRQWTAKSWKAYDRRRALLRQFGQVKVHSCPQCGGKEWAEVPPPYDAPENSMSATTTIWTALAAALAVILVLTLCSPVRGQPAPVGIRLDTLEPIQDGATIQVSDDRGVAICVYKMRKVLILTSTSVVMSDLVYGEAIEAGQCTMQQGVIIRQGVTR